MPYIFTLKAAITAGAILGSVAAVVHNKELLLEKAEEILQHGADTCRNLLEELKAERHQVNTNAEESSFESRDSENEETESARTSDSYWMIRRDSDFFDSTTPDISSDEEVELASLD
ncbi:Piso0_004145 [Millerozyma farinosa CBS 7064]|uniref:Piso0_004145 protein n=1 Tax=Pichia sorbitophila (strain ATCC MYA-4447 / BCRC 22081 / CBS 7064 / NBRC 10061 / NRRL Y-12695) TaxID=559304 RepID=G8Y7L6_PICSO|nr:Piso0_004145 [Millerozyma farinosa CBS 7064]CCE84596.1 Piso0_004145 [Millerozyma farinosa CBS 7064]